MVLVLESKGLYFLSGGAALRNEPRGKIPQFDLLQSSRSYVAFHTCLYFIYARKIYVRTHGKITRQRKSTLRRNAQKVHLFTSRYLDRLNVIHCYC